MPLTPEQKQILPISLASCVDSAVRQSHSTKKPLLLSDVRNFVYPIIDDVAKISEESRIGYVSGVISGQGEHRIGENIARLATWTDELRDTHDFPVFGPPDIFIPQMYKVLLEAQLDKVFREPLFNFFWRALILAKVTDIFMTPNWQSGKGTWIELETAQEKGVQVHYID